MKMMYDNGQIMDITDIMDENLAPLPGEVLNSDGGLWPCRRQPLTTGCMRNSKVGSPLMTAKGSLGTYGLAGKPGAGAA